MPAEAWPDAGWVLLLVPANRPALGDGLRSGVRGGSGRSRDLWQFSWPD